ncbi:predicted protein [Plenodomus lingam JN3]|uniref:Predicted protein n=1 Tax=Leptosphaeria maculans (strain JN3 / isolate v23.1.3 / race Av1-4-5-6-7-8) TaxID=985895 RepID=E5A0T4_LEPMJ|nr:predicted protein [Plenodomus lingam JN3]CBX97230.1 predicted protein [Plenodomus lingam JN3]
MSPTCVNKVHAFPHSSVDVLSQSITISISQHVPQYASQTCIALRYTTCMVIDTVAARAPRNSAEIPDKESNLN